MTFVAFGALRIYSGLSLPLYIHTLCMQTAKVQCMNNDYASINIKE